MMRLGSRKVPLKSAWMQRPSPSATNHGATRSRGSRARLALAPLVAAALQACYSYSSVAGEVPPAKTVRVRFTTPREVALAFASADTQRLRLMGGVVGRVLGARGDTLEMQVLSVLDLAGRETKLTSAATALVPRDSATLIDRRSDRTLPIVVVVGAAAVLLVSAVALGGIGGGGGRPGSPAP